MEDKGVQTIQQHEEPQLTTERLILLSLENISKTVNSLSHCLRESNLEHKKNYAAINAQLHIISERIRNPEHYSQQQGLNGIKPRLQRDLLRQISRERSRGPDGINDDLSGSETVHRECLTETLEEMVKDMDINNTHLMDELLDNECLTQDEASVVSEIPLRKDQIRKLIILFAKRSRANFVKFLEVISRKHHYPDIGRKLRLAYERKMGEDRGSECLICVIKRDVDIRDVVDRLCHRQIIDVDFLDLVVSSKQSRDQSGLWEIVFSNIDKSTDRKSNIQYLQEALCKKYENLATKLGIRTPSQLGNHHCTKTEMAEEQDFSKSWRSTTSVESSVGDQSTTSEIQQKPVEVRDSQINTMPLYSNIPDTIQWLISTENVSISSQEDVNDECHDLSTSANLHAVTFSSEENRNDEQNDLPASTNSIDQSS